MASIAANNEINVLKIREFLGLNENPDGDTNLKNGELSELRNFRITQDRHLQLRPGTRTLIQLREAWDTWAASHIPTTKTPRFCGAWSGLVHKKAHLVAAFGGVLFDVDILTEAVRVVGTCTEDETTFFGFNDRVYLLNGHEYMSWDGQDTSQFRTVEGYVPTIQTATNPAGAGTVLENVNRLTGKRKVRFSPDGKATEFFLPEKNIDAVISVDGSDISYTVDAGAGKISFSSVVAEGVNSLTVTYRKGEGTRGQVTAMRYAELFNGVTDARVFLYGDGTNKTIYSGNDLDQGIPSAEYFPDLYEAGIGEENTPVTAMVRHYSRLMAFKTDSAWAIDHSITADANGAVLPAFYVTAVNRQYGNEAPGQVRLLENNPLTLDGKAVYQWKVAGNVTADNRSASRLSDRVRDTLGAFSLADTKTFHRKSENEFWFLYNAGALIFNNSNDTWYFYNNMPFLQMLEIEGQAYGFTEDGRIVHVSRQYRNDDGADIDAYAATGSMNFDRSWMLKYSPLIFVGIQPESGARITVTVESNRRSDYPEKIIAAGFSTFTNVDFAHWSFGTNRKPRVKRVKMKVKKATFYKLIFKSVSASATATVLETDIQLRYTGNVK